MKRLGAVEKSAIHQALETVGIEDRARDKVGDLSGGQQQRAFLARALVSDPDLLILDEPTSGIDGRTTEAICCLLGHLHQDQGISILMVTHDLHSIRDHAQRVLLLEGGGLRESSPQGYLYQNRYMQPGK